MKPNPKIILFSVALSALLGYLIYSLADGGHPLLLTLLSAFSFLVISVLGFGLKVENSHANVNAKVLALVFYIVALIAAIVLALTGASVPAIIIATSIILLFYLLSLYVIPKNGV